jgi:hypothetical protein
MENLQKGHYKQTPMADINESFKAQKMLTSKDWKRMYSGGAVTNWLQQSTDFFMANARIKDFTPASRYFDPGLHSISRPWGDVRAEHELCGAPQFPGLCCRIRHVLRPPLNTLSLLHARPRCRTLLSR